jgi:hypothetical protein
MNAADVTSALATRKTVRITYSRNLDTYRVDIVRGDDILETIREGVLAEDLAELYATTAARYRDGLDITRLDVP